MLTFAAGITIFILTILVVLLHTADAICRQKAEIQSIRHTLREHNQALTTLVRINNDLQRTIGEREDWADELARTLIAVSIEEKPVH